MLENETIRTVERTIQDFNKENWSMSELIVSLGVGNYFILNWVQRFICAYNIRLSRFVVYDSILGCGSKTGLE